MNQEILLPMLYLKCVLVCVCMCGTFIADPLGETLTFSTATAEDGARLDVSADSFGVADTRGLL